MMSKKLSDSESSRSTPIATNKRQKVSEDDQEDSGTMSVDSLSNSQRNSKDDTMKSNLKGESGFNLNRLISQKPKKNITAYAFYIKEVSCLHYS